MRAVARQVNSKLLRLLQKVALSGVVGDEDPLPIPHLARSDMLISLGVLADRMDMNSPLVGKRGITDIRLMLVVRKIGDFADEVGDLSQAFELLIGNAVDLHFDF